MVAGLSVALMLLAPVAADAAPPAAAPSSYGPVVPPAPKPKPASAPTEECRDPNGEDQEIVICALRPEGYRLNPDLMEAKRQMRSGGKPTKVPSGPRPDCVSVGPAGCSTGGVDIVGAVLTAAQMAKRVVEGKEIGSMFQTDPHPSEYELYQMAKARREAREAEEALIKAGKKAKADAAAAAVTTEAQPSAAEPRE